VFAISRFVSLGSILASIAFAVLAFMRGYGKFTPWLLGVCVIVPLIVIAKHHANIRRLLTGTEYRFGKTKAAAA
ncbi:MAG TPA: glycerol-3-phosphate acyltransferase, partial [Acidobacteriaceae bacterium]|nr:glycerol-3-phosphate acyltransferase [Acidobacteriaceae bacterium]